MYIVLLTCYICIFKNKQLIWTCFDFFFLNNSRECFFGNQENTFCVYYYFSQKILWEILLFNRKGGQHILDTSWIRKSEHDSWYPCFFFRFSTLIFNSHRPSLPSTVFVDETQSETGFGLHPSFMSISMFLPSRFSPQLEGFEYVEDSCSYPYV